MHRGVDVVSKRKKRNINPLRLYTGPEQWEVDNIHCIAVQCTDILLDVERGCSVYVKVKYLPRFLLLKMICLRAVICFCHH